jgi:fucose permease
VIGTDVKQISLAGLEFIASMAAFRNATAASYIEFMRHSSETQKSSLKDVLTKGPFARVTWLCAMFLLGYVGTEVALGGWIVTFMIRVRHGEEFASGMTATGFWLGLAIGRIILGFVTPRIGEKLAIIVGIPCNPYWCSSALSMDAHCAASISEADQENFRSIYPS